MPEFQLIIFDCDGVLVDSEKLTTRVFVEVVNALGWAIDFDEALQRFKGGKMADTVIAIEQQIGRALPPDFVPSFRHRMAEVFRAELQPVTGIVEALDQITLPACVASSGPPEKIQLSLTLTGLLPRFAGRIFSAYEINSWKPAPDLFLHAARTCNVAPAHCAVIEDSLTGVRAGIAAGMRVFAYSETGDGAELAAEGAQVFYDMHTLPELLRQAS